MIDPMLMRLNQVLYQERLEAATQARRRATNMASFNLFTYLRSALGAQARQPAVPVQVAPRKLDRKVTQ